MNIRIHITILLILLCSTVVWGQEVRIPIEPCEKHKASLDSLTKVILELRYINSAQDSTNKTEIHLKDSTNKTEIHLKDSLITCQNNKLHALNKQFLADSMRLIIAHDSLSGQKDSLTVLHQSLVEMKKRVEFADRCIARFSNGRLFQSYDNELVNEAMEMFSKIENKDILREFEEVPSLLDRYEADFLEITTIINNAQKDQDRTNIFNADSYKGKYTNEIRNSQYYRLYYNKEWNIPYLNRQIDKVLKRLKNHNTKGNPYANFIDILEDNE